MQNLLKRQNVFIDKGRSDVLLQLWAQTVVKGDSSCAQYRESEKTACTRSAPSPDVLSVINVLLIGFEESQVSPCMLGLVVLLVSVQLSHEEHTLSFCHREGDVPIWSRTCTSTEASRLPSSMLSFVRFSVLGWICRYQMSAVALDRPSMSKQKHAVSKTGRL